MIPSVVDWRVLDEETLSLHHYLYYSLRDPVVPRPDPRQPQPQTGWCLRSLDRDRLVNSLRDAHASAPIRTPQRLDEAMRAACTAAMRAKRTPRRKQVYWWTAEIADLRRSALYARRTYQRKRRRSSEEHCHYEKNAAKLARDALKAAIAASQRRCWKQLCEDVDADPWGEGYRIVTKRLGARTPAPVLSCEGASRIVDTLFPQHRLVCWVRPPREPRESFPHVTEEELSAACTRLRNGKSPGPDGVAAEVVKIAVSELPEVFLHTFDNLLLNGTFPSPWKVARLVLIRKGDKPLDEPSSYRPLCLLNAVGKLFEHVLHARLRTEIDDRGGLSDRQYGFRQGRGTVDAIRRVVDVAAEANSGTWRTRNICAMVTFDVRNAFNSASWRHVVAELRRRNVTPYLLEMVMSYLQDRCVTVACEEGSIHRDVTCGVPQGSILAPLLWNIHYDGVLRLPTPEGVDFVAYADDLALVVPARDEARLRDSGDQAIRQVRQWMQDHALTIAPEKTEAILFTGRRKTHPIVFTVGGQQIVPGRTLKYLGVIFDSGLTFSPHVTSVAARAANINAALSRLLPNVGGPGPCKRRLLRYVAESTMLYAAPVWHGALDKGTMRRKLASAQRRMALRITSAYRTAAENAVLVIARTPPVDILARDRARAVASAEKPTKAERLAFVLGEWQRRWDDCQGWTRRIVPDVASWYARPHGETNYFLTQVLTGHGSFGSYLHRIGKRDTGACPYCGEESDTPEHTLFSCDRWERERRILVAHTGELTADNVTERILESDNNWASFQKFVTRVMSRKERDERDLEANGDL